VFFAHDPANPATIHHVGMYVGQGLMVHAPPHRGAGPGGRRPPWRLRRRHPPAAQVGGYGLGLAVGPRQGNSTVWFQQLGPGLYWDNGSPH
jgi:cell wall-associated NlpC family hydrolase